MKRKIAGEDEILEYLTGIMRGDSEGAAKRDSLRAAELIGKRYGMFDKKEEKKCELTVKVDYGDGDGPGEPGIPPGTHQ